MKRTLSLITSICRCIWRRVKSSWLCSFKDDEKLRIWIYWITEYYLNDSDALFWPDPVRLHNPFSMYSSPPTYWVFYVRITTLSHLSSSMLTRSISKLLEMETFAVGDRLKLLFKSVVQEVIEPSTRRLKQSLKDMENVVSTMRMQLKAPDDKIESLEREVTHLTAPSTTSSNKAVDAQWEFLGSRKRVMTTEFWPCPTVVWSSDLLYLLRT